MELAFGRAKGAAFDGDTGRARDRPVGLPTPMGGRRDQALAEIDAAQPWDVDYVRPHLRRGQNCLVGRDSYRYAASAGDTGPASIANAEARCRTLSRASASRTP